MDNVYAYIRVSTLTQVEKGYGLKTQEEAIIKYCKDNKLNLINIFADKGITGTDADRPSLMDLLAAIKEGEKIVVLNTSRLWRSDTVKVLLHREFKKKKVDVISIEQSNYSIYTKDPNDFLINSMMELLDQYDRMSIALKLSKGRRTKAKHGSKACGVAPLGYKWNDKAEIIIDDETAPLIKLIFKKYLELTTLGKVKSFLDGEGYSTNRNKSFSKQAIRDILSNSFYIGIVTHADVKEKGNHEPIINKIIFGKVQSLMNKRKL